MEIIILVGSPASGKSTFYHEKLAATHLRINLDTLKTRSREKAMMSTYFAGKQQFVVDNTNPTREARARYTVPARAAGYKIICYYIECDHDEAMRRNQERSNSVPAIAIHTFTRKLELPNYTEDFDEIYRVSEGQLYLMAHEVGRYQSQGASSG